MFLELQGGLVTLHVCIFNHGLKGPRIKWPNLAHVIHELALVLPGLQQGCPRGKVGYISCALSYQDLGVSQNSGYYFGGPYNKDYSIFGSILGFPYFGKLPFEKHQFNAKE